MKILISILVIIMIFLVGCVSIPKEAVDLSYAIGKDLTAIHVSYKKLIQQHFQLLREQAIFFINEKWMPVYIEDFIIEGELIENAIDEDFEYVYFWALVAAEEIEAKKKELLDPINADEKELITLVDEAFAQLYLANATVTAHLNSALKVKEAQNEVLEASNLKELRDKIDDSLASSSEKAKEAIKLLEKTDKLINKLK